MHRLVLMTAVLATTITLPAAANAAFNKKVYLNYSRAQFINICTRV